MVKKMNKRKRMVRGAAVFVTLAAIAVIVRALIRKRRPRITYGPMHERDQAHKADAPFLNTPIEHYHAMATIFGTTAASGMNARSGNDLLSIDVEDEENGEVNTSPNVAESSHPKGPPKKKAKVVKVLEDPLVTTLNYGFKLVADALVKSGDDDDIPAELWDEVCKLGEFDEEHLAHYYAHLVDNPKIAKAFMTLSQTNKSVWVSRYVKKNF